MSETVKRIDLNGILARGEKLRPDSSGHIPFFNAEYPRFRAMVIIKNGQIAERRRGFGNDAERSFTNIQWIDRAEPSEMAEALQKTQAQFVEILEEIMEVPHE